MHLGPHLGRAIRMLDAAPLGFRQEPIGHCLPRTVGWHLLHLEGSWLEARQDLAPQMGSGPTGRRGACTSSAQASRDGAAVDADLLNRWPCEGGEHTYCEALAILGRPLRAK
eukprot:5160673-Pyramimonas_sp.AAC.1